ncbi:MAG: AbrB/MazE/SpoVT family DNA-binding domain-containing protein [Candidatus Aenigmarchaeota archaeon]|nr:AbrB/MazE/SpoVT family DNA-binding domain-containing protein [Candidatus Aenigmarchaeota archaeon]
MESLSFTSIPDHRGRITIPASVRKKLKVKTDSRVLIVIKKILRGEKDER